MKKFFFIGLPLSIILAGGVLYLSGRNFLTEPCGCGPPSAEATGEYQRTDELAVFNNQVISNKMEDLKPSLESLKLEKGAVLGTSTDERWIEIDLSEQKLYAHEEDRIVYEFLISSGKWAPTPTGEFRIWIKLRYAKMSGGSRALRTYYYLPNVPYIQYFYKGYGLHGVYWHNNFGQPMSHGCVNLAIPDAEKLFYWTSPVVSEGKNMAVPTKDHPGTKLIIHD